MAEPDPTSVFDFDVSRDDRLAIDQWGVVRIVRAGQELPDGWHWRDEPERPQAA